MSRILVVDDMQSERDLITSYLTKAGYTVTTACNGLEALDKVKEDKPDAIVTDWMMPKMGGIDICRKLKKDPNTADIPIIACTAKDRDVDRLWAKKQGIKGYITKPCNQEELVSTLLEAMG